MKKDQGSLSLHSFRSFDNKKIEEDSLLIEKKIDNTFNFKKIAYDSLYENLCHTLFPEYFEVFKNKGFFLKLFDSEHTLEIHFL